MSDVFTFSPSFLPYNSFLVLPTIAQIHHFFFNDYFYPHT